MSNDVKCRHSERDRCNNTRKVLIVVKWECYFLSGEKCRVAECPPFSKVDISDVFLVGIYLFSLGVVTLSSITRLGVFITESTRPVVSLLLSFIEECLVMGRGQVASEF